MLFPKPVADWTILSVWPMAVAGRPVDLACATCAPQRQHTLPVHQLAGDMRFLKTTPTILNVVAAALLRIA